jgi:hypothetical protein
MASSTSSPPPPPQEKTTTTTTTTETLMMHSTASANDVDELPHIPRWFDKNVAISQGVDNRYYGKENCDQQRFVAQTIGHTMGDNDDGDRISYDPVQSNSLNLSFSGKTCSHQGNHYKTRVTENLRSHFKMQVYLHKKCIHHGLRDISDLGLIQSGKSHEVWSNLKAQYVEDFEKHDTGDKFVHEIAPKELNMAYSSITDNPPLGVADDSEDEKVYESVKKKKVFTDDQIKLLLTIYQLYLQRKSKMQKGGSASKVVRHTHASSASVQTNSSTKCNTGISLSNSSIGDQEVSLMTVVHDGIDADSRKSLPTVKKMQDEDGIIYR